MTAFLRILYFILYPVLFTLFVFLYFFKIITFREFLERLGLNKIEKKKEPFIWIHLSSAGEFMTAKKVIKKIHDSGENIFLTYFYRDAGTVAAKSSFISMSQFLPCENFLAYKKIITQYQIKRIIIFETEIWPFLLQTADETYSFISFQCVYIR